MKVFNKEYILEYCMKCGAYGLIEVTAIEFGGDKFKYLLCKECMKDVIVNICQMEINRT